MRDRASLPRGIAVGITLLLLATGVLFVTSTNIPSKGIIGYFIMSIAIVILCVALLRNR